MIGKLLNNRFEILEKVDGTVVFDCYKALDKDTNKEVYLRVAQPEVTNAEFSEALEEVIDVTSRIRGNGIEKTVGVYSFEGQPYIVCEYFAATTLDARLKKLSTLSVPVSVAFAIDLCDAIEPLHQEGIIHGDVSTKNILMTSDEGMKLVMPGYWRAYSKSEVAAKKVFREMSPYLAPEVTAGGMPTQASDIYAIGILLWRTLIGRFPYAGENAIATSTQHATQEYPSLKEINGSIPMPLDEVVKKALDKNPLKRYASVKALRADLQKIQDALRFGRPMTWPLILDSEEAPELEEVAPKLNAIDGKPEREEPIKEKSEKISKKKSSSKKKNKKMSNRDDRVPAWLTGMFYVMTVLAILVVGAWISFNFKKPKKLAVPNIVGKQIEEARQELKEMDLKIREVRREQSDKYSAGEILVTAPAEGEDIYAGTYIECIVSSGSEFVEIPDFRGRDLSEVRELCRSLDLIIDDDDVSYVRDKDLEKGLVISHIPEAGKEVKRDTHIKLKLSNGDERVRTGTSSKRNYYRVSFPIPGGLQHGVTVRIDMTDDRGTKTVYERDLDPGDEVSERFPGYGDRIIFRVFFDGELIDQITQEATEAEE